MPDKDNFGAVIEQVAQPIAVDIYNYTTNERITQTIRSQKNDTDHIGAVIQPVSLDCYNQSVTGDKVGIIREQHGTNMNAIAVDWRTTQVDVEMTGTLKTDLAKMSGPCVAVDAYNQTINEKTTQTIGSSASDVNHYGAVLEPKAVDFRNGKIDGDVTMTLQSKPNGGYSVNCQPGVLQTMAIRRLTPKECERLQGFPDDWTRIPYRNKPADQCPDGPRYKACGNSMAVPVMRWIGTRIQMIENYLNQ